MTRCARLLAVPLLLALAACGSGPHRPHVVIVLVDQLRQDAFEQWAPRLSALAERGLRTESMRAAAPWTYPSVVSLMSGLYPQQHGADGHMEENVLSSFSRELPLLPGLLSQVGYRTAAFVTNPFLHTWNPFHEAFDSYDVSFIGSQGNRRGNPRSVWKKKMFADSVNAAVRAHFDAGPPRAPEFTYVHYIDVHGPWDEAPFPPDYESSVRWIDERVVDLYELALERYDGDLIFIVTSDHGRDLADDELVGDGLPLRKNKVSVFDFNLLIPFAVLPSARVTEPRLVQGPCSNVDVLPTLLDWLAIEPAVSLPGRSLLPALQSGTPLDPERPLYARMSAFGFRQDCLVQGGHKYMRVFDPETGALTARRVFDLERDVREIDSLGEDFGPAAAALERAAGSHGLRFDTTDEAIDPELQADLQALGYLGARPDDG